jgi:serine/threonine protein kinase
MRAQTPRSSSGRGPLTLGKYRLVQRLGRGGMAEVWRAKILGPAGFERQLVVKRILPHLVEEEHFVQMFVAEARLSARLSHPNIVQVYELGDVDGEYFLAMEYVRGKDLVSVVRSFLSQGSPPIGLSALVMREVCRALAYAHGFCDEDGQPLRIIHRDVTPSNVMVSYEGVVKLLDFGVAKALAEVSDAKTQTGVLKGKVGYLSPEQAEGGPIDHRADIFSVGIVLHELLTGERLFKATGGELQTLALVRTAKISPPSHTNPDVPDELDRICMKALARVPADRYSSCDELANDLDAVARELGWNQDRLARTLREMFSAEATEPQIGGDGSRSRLGPDAGRRLRTASFVLAGIAAAGIAAAIALPHALREHARGAQPAALTASSSPETGAAAAPTVAPAPAPAPAPAEVHVLVDSTPERAEVFVDRETDSRGYTPLTLTLPRSATPVPLVVRARGYQPSSTRVTPLLDAQVKLVLVQEAPAKRARPERATVRQARAPAPAPSTGAKPPDVRKGDVVDPF